MKAVLGVAGSDSSGGAGIQADIKTIASYGLYAETVITAITAQNTCGVRAVQDISPEVVGAQIDAVFEDIPPRCGEDRHGILRPDHQCHRRASAFPSGARRGGRPGHGGHQRLSPHRAAGCRCAGLELVPLADVITPNMPEAEVLCGFPVADDEGMMQAAKLLRGKPTGPCSSRAAIVLIPPTTCSSCPMAVTLRSAEKRIATGNTHGTGCTLSSAIASGLAQGNGIEQAVAPARKVSYGALCQPALTLGRAIVPLDHMWCHGKPHLPYSA